MLDRGGLARQRRHRERRRAGREVRVDHQVAVASPRDGRRPLEGRVGALVVEAPVAPVVAQLDEVDHPVGEAIGRALYDDPPAAFNLNGIVVDDDRGDDQGRHRGDRHGHKGDRRADKLIVVDTDTGQLFRVKVGKDGNAARRIREVAVKNHGPFTGGDGLLIDRGDLLVVQGSNPADGFPNGVVNFLGLRNDGRRARLEDQRTDDSFQGPSTIARARDRYLVVNPDFATSTTPFTVTALPR